MGNERPSPATLPSAVLLAEDDAQLCQVFGRELERLGCRVRTVGTTWQLLDVGRSSECDFALVDVFLSNGRSVDSLATLRAEGRRLPPAVFISGFWTVELARFVGTLGALEAIEKPIWSGDLGSILSRNWAKHLATADSLSELASADRPITFGATTNAARWTDAIVKISTCEGDPHTIALAANAASMSESSFEELCHVLMIGPREARDLARMLRALILSKRERCKIEALLNASEKTIVRLHAMAGIARGSEPGTITIDRFLCQQKFVAADDRAIFLLRRRFDT